jgi:hypothetical protein
MAYIINTYNTAQLTVVEDGTIDQTTDIKLVGKNYAGYGEIQNENFIFLLENFAGNNEPPKAIIGQIWFDSANSRLKYYDGSKWRLAGGSEVSETPPAGNVEGDFWWDTANDQLYVWNGTEFILVGPQGVGDSVTRFQSRTIRDTNNVARPVIVSVIDDEIVHVISAVDFYIAADELPNYPGFDVIHSGLTLKNTVDSTAGQTSTIHRWWGTATNSDRLGGLTADKFVQSDGASFTERVGFGDEGIAIGNSNDLRIKIINDNQALFANEQGTNMFFQVRDINGNLRMPFRLLDSAILPGYDILFDPNASSPDFSAGTVRAVDVGSATAPFQNMYASTFKGVADSAVALSVTTTGGTIQAAADINAVPNTIAARTSTGDLNANVFFGTATSARFADLAEIYEADKEYEPGTVLIYGGDKEVTASNTAGSYYIIGVVSTNPAHLMNDKAEGVAVALRGRVPCKVIGPVKKGSIIISSNEPGIGIATDNMPHATAIVGRSLEDNKDPNVKLVEIVV